MAFWEYRPYVSAAQRRMQAQQEMAKLRKTGHPVSPVLIEGRTIVKTFWGKAWCENLERYSDYANRLPRGCGNPRQKTCPLRHVPNASSPVRETPMPDGLAAKLREAVRKLR